MGRDHVPFGPLAEASRALGAVAVHASGPTRVRGIEFIRGKETGCVAKTYPGYFDDLAALGGRGVA